jgi:Domain of unknown function (DUF4124)
MPAARRSACAALAAALACAATLASAQVVYRWIDADGKVHYGDQLPKGYTGPVTRIETDKPADPPPGATPGVTIIKPPKRTEVSPPPTEDIATKRRETREELEKRVTAAREKLEAARKARNEAPDAQEDEVQIVRRIMDPAQQGVPRSNCTPGRDANGNVFLMCPSPVPGDAYYERIRKLDEAVTKAEDDLAAAQQAYRRGVD